MDHEEKLRQDLIEEHYLSPDSIFITLALNVPIDQSEYLEYHDDEDEDSEV